MALEWLSNGSRMALEWLSNGSRMALEWLSNGSVKIATTGHQWARKELPDLDLIVLDNAASCALEVVQGKADAFIYDQISIFQFWQQNKEETRPVLNAIREET